MFAVMIGNEPGDALKIKRAVNLLNDILTMSTVDPEKLSGLSHDLPDIQDLLSWFKNIDGIMNTLQYADAEA